MERKTHIVVVGCGGVGKSNLTCHFTGEGKVKRVTFKGIEYVFDVTNINSEEGLSEVRYRPGATGFLCVYDITSEKSFKGLVGFHSSILRHEVSKRVPIVLIGNKCDLEDQRQIKKEEGEALAKKWGCLFIETSATTSKNIDKLLTMMVEEIEDKTFFNQVNPTKEDMTELNVGGVVHLTSIQNLRDRFPFSRLAALFRTPLELNRNDRGQILLDRNGVVFGHLLDFLRSGTIPEGLSREDIHRLHKEIEFWDLRHHQEKGDKEKEKEKEKEKKKEKEKENDERKERKRGPLYRIPLADFYKLIQPNKDGVSLQGLDVSEYSFEGCILTKANLMGSDVTNCSFRGADLQAANFSRATCVNADFHDAILARANFREANLTRATFGHADLSYANLSATNLSGLDLSGCKLTNANLSESILTGTLLPSDLTGVRMSGINLIGRDFSKSNLANAQFAHSSLKDVILPKVLTGVNFSGVDLSGRDFTACNLNMTTLTNANLSDANLSNCKMMQANLTGCNITRANLHQATLTGAILVNTVDETQNFLEKVKPGLTTRMKANEIQTLDLNGHVGNGNELAKSLAEALRHNTSLHTLYLYNNAIGDEGAIALAETLKHNTTLHTMFLYNNSIGDEGAKALAETLKHNTTLQIIMLHNNLIGNEGARAIAEALQHNNTLHTLNLDNNQIRPQGKVALSAVQASRKFTYFSFNWKE